MPEDPTHVYDKPRFSGFTSFSIIFSFLYCMMISDALISIPISGGALFLLGRVAILFTRFGSRGFRKLLSVKLRVAMAALTTAVFLAALLLAVIYPAKLVVPLSQSLILAGIVFLSTLRETLTRRLLRACHVKRFTKARTKIRAFELHSFFFLPIAFLLFFTQPLIMAFYMLTGYILSAILEYATLRSDHEVNPPSVDIDSIEVNQLSQVYAYRVFQNMTLFTSVALQVTLMLAFALVGYSVNDLLYRMVTAAFCLYITRRITVRLLSGNCSKNADPAIVMVSGICLWLCGLLLLARNIVMTDLLESYISLVLCTCGVTASIITLAYFENDMRQVAAFSMGHPPTPAYDIKRKMLLEFANLTGQTLALLGLAIIFYYSAGNLPDSLNVLEKSLRPTLLLPALTLVLLTLLTALKFPMTNGSIRKLRRFLQLKDHGQTNLPLQRQLEDVLIKISRRHYGMKLLLSFLRPLYYHRILGRENVVIEDGTSVVFVCNHGELYGPIVANLYIPYSFRPWTISELTDHKELTDYIYQFTFIRQRWIIPCMKRPMAHCLMPVILWVFNSIESVAVYKAKPRELIRTFRITAAAMEAGDNILIFPENPQSQTQDRPGYLKDGLGEFHSGFTMLGPMYYERTGKRLQFIPIYADKKRRTLTFGKSVCFDPDALPIPEKKRIIKHLRDEMLSILKEAQTQVPSNNGVKM